MINTRSREREDIPTVDLHELATGRYLTSLSQPRPIGAAVRASLGADGQVLVSWAAHAMVRERPTHLVLHALPFGLERALAVAKERLTQISTVFDTALTPQ